MFDEEVGALDPHLWLDPLLVPGYVEAIRDAFVDLDPAGAEAYRANATAYLARLDILDSSIAKQVATVPAERRKLVTTHDAFRYFGARYGLEVVGTMSASRCTATPSARRAPGPTPTSA